MFRFEIKPYESVGLINFGSTCDDVISAIGEPDIIKTNNDKKYFHYSWGLVKFSSVPHKVVEVTIFQENNVVIKNISVFSESNALKKLLKLESQAYECVGFLFLLDLGITLSGFHKKESERIISAFARNHTESIRSSFNLYKP